MLSIRHQPAAGEAQKIDRIMEKFAERFVRCNPGAFANADGAYLLAFALIMLNTDAHNPMADAHMTREDFVSMCQQVCGCQHTAPIGASIDQPLHSCSHHLLQTHTAQPQCRAMRQYISDSLHFEPHNHCHNTITLHCRAQIAAWYCGD